MVLNEMLAEKQYDAEETTAWCKEISSEIKEKLKGAPKSSFDSGFDGKTKSSQTEPKLFNKNYFFWEMP